jgi:hypothetical protein
MGAGGGDQATARSLPCGAGIVERGCLSRPVADKMTLQQWVLALEAERNERRATINWQFTSHQARVKLKRLYPAVQSHQD